MYKGDVSRDPFVGRIVKLVSFCSNENNEVHYMYLVVRWSFYIQQLKELLCKLHVELMLVNLHRPKVTKKDRLPLCHFWPV